MKRTRHYSDDFRQEAVNLLLSSWRSIKTVAEELGITANSLRNWRQRAISNGREAKADPAQPAGRSAAPVADAAAEIRRLQRENDYLRRQREILKKAMSILSETPRSEML